VKRREESEERSEEKRRSEERSEQMRRTRFFSFT
jgi:hypothetical protein